MALKKETQQVRYTEQIGVNRGGGFAAMADASITQANQLNNLTSQFADLGLKELKSFGTKIGKEAAENAVFSEVEQTVKLDDGTEIKQMIPAPIPKLNVGKFAPTVSMQEAYDKNIYDKYEKEVQTSVRNIILEERANVIADNGTGEQFNTIVNARLEPLLKELEPKFGQVIDTYKSTQQQQHWYQVEAKYLDYRDKIENLEYTNGLNVLQNEHQSLLINNAPKKLIDAKEQELKNHIKKYTAMGNDNAVATGKLQLKQLNNNKKAFVVLQNIIPNDMSSLSGNEQKIVVDDLLKLEQLLQGGVKSITLSNKTVIKNSDVPKLFNNDATAQSNFATRVSKIRTDFNTGLDAKMKTNLFSSYLANNMAIAPSGMPPHFGTLSKKEIQTSLETADSIELLASGYNSLTGTTVPISKFDQSAYQDINFVKYVMRTTNQLPFFLVNQIEQSLKGNNQQAISTYFNNGLIPTIQNMETSFTTKSNDGKNAFTSTMKLSNMALLGLNDETIAKINTIDNYSTIMPVNEAIALTVSYYDKMESSNIKSGNMKQHLANSGSKIGETKLNMRILKQIESIVDTDSFIGADAIFSRKIYELVKTDVHRMVLNGGGLINTEGDIDVYVKESMARIMSPDSQFGYDKYTFTSFETPSDMDWNSQPEERFVYAPLKKYFALPNAKGEETVEWMKEPIDKLVKSSMEYKEDISLTTKKNPFKYEFGKNIFLQPSSFTEGSPKYNIVHLDSNDIPTILTDDNGIPITYDPKLDYTTRKTLMVGSKNFESSIDKAKKNQLKFVDDNRILESGLTVEENRMLENLDAKDKVEGVSDFDNFQNATGIDTMLKNRGFR
ncbi:hypothetical protein [uncultured Mediterranean phage uvMED]|nr:hypothetical protein [uncultured Mediterranean phage uvMED]